MKKEEGRKIIAERVEDFEKNKAILTKKGHGETNIRSNYIDIMFKALGWDMKSHYEVVREYSQRDKSTTGGTKKVDYAFKINGKLKFFIEAKEASVDLEKDKNAIYQAKRYAYSSNGKAPIVILTDFEEYRVFNVLKAPIIDNPDRDLLQSHCMKYTDYLEKWDLLWDTFSREAVGKGSLDSLRGKIDKNTRTMDVDFLAQITEWREILAKNIAVRNESLNVDEINEAVQRILDRLVFIRNLEDREIEPENMLFDKAHKSDNVYKSLIPLFNSLDKTYNGLLFKKHFSEEIEVDDKTIKDIIRQMCYPVSPFQFDVIEPEILGRIYEKFLGSKIRLTDSHRAKIEEKIEVRKAGGVYYTPEYIVEYIVKNTVGTKIEGLGPEEIKEIKIIDPACGSGSFLLGAYSYLLDYHQKWYLANQKDKKYQVDWYKTKDGEIKVKLDKRADILRNNIFGVDIDKEATEVAIMSLYLKMLDDGFDKGQKELFFEKGSILPDMSNNIKSGNSIISTDYFDGRLNYEIEELKKIKPFNWNKEYFNIINNGGFDCIIGNPPYVTEQVEKNERDYFFLKYKDNVGKINTYRLLTLRAIEILKNNGLFGYIIPNTYLTNRDSQYLRKEILDKTSIKEILLFPEKAKVFQNVTQATTVLIFEKNNDSENKIKTKLCENEKEIFNNSYYLIEQSIYHNILENMFIINISNDSLKLALKLLNEYDTFDSITEIYQGEVNVSINKDLIKNTKVSEYFKPLIRGNDVYKYFIDLSGENSKGSFVDTSNNDFRGHYFNKRIVTQEVSNMQQKLRIKSSILDKGFLCGHTTNYLILRKEIDLSFILGIINSKLINWFFTIFNNTNHIPAREIKRFPFPLIDFNNLKNNKMYLILTECVNEMLKTMVNYYESEKENDKKLYEQKIDLLERKINETVYTLYKLTDDEIKIIESF